MRIGRPRTLLSLILLGLGLVSLPLVIGIGNAAIKLGQLADASESVVGESTVVTRENQRLVSLLTDMERNARQYLVLGDEDLLEIYEADHAALVTSLETLRRMPQAQSTAEQIETLGDTARAVRRLVESGPDLTANEELATQFQLMIATARGIGRSMSIVISERLGALQADTRAAQRSLAWQMSALVPGTIGLVLLFALLVGRPMRRVDRAIRDLGGSDFTHPIRITGPTDIEKLGRQLEWLRHRLRESTEEKNKFLRHMSHELKTPLANIRESTELLLDGAVGRLDHQQQEVVGILRENGVKLQSLIENLLTFSQWQARTMQVDVSDFELKPLVFSVLSQHRLVIARRGLKLNLWASPVTIRADEGKVRLVLENLISNAIKFTPDGGRIYVKAGLDDAGELAIDVGDSGPGIAPEDGERVFEAFYQGRRLQGGPLGGTGIGLSVVAECCEAHGGSVELVTDGRRFPGAHFKVRLPLQGTVEQHAMAANA